MADAPEPAADKAVRFVRKQDGHIVTATHAEMEDVAGWDDDEWEELPEPQPIEWEQPKDEAKPAAAPPTPPTPPQDGGEDRN